MNRAGINWNWKTWNGNTIAIKVFWLRSVIKKILIMLVGINLADDVLNYVLGLRDSIHGHVAVLGYDQTRLDHGVKDLLLH